MDKTNKIKDEKYIARASITPASVEQSADFDFSCIAVPTNNKQLRYSSNNNEYFYQILKTEKENIDVNRMDSGLPLFDNHPYDNSASNQLGITVSYEFVEAGIKMNCKFGARADEALRADVKNGIVKTVSIEGDIINYSVERTEGSIPNYYAELWQPTSLSFSPIPNDIEAQIDVKRAVSEQINKSNIKPKLSKLKQLINKF